jgi:hypothetical protein
LLKTFGGAEAVMRLGSGQCYHKQVWLKSNVRSGREWV